MHAAVDLRIGGVVEARRIVRSGEIAYTTLFFAVSCILIFAFALVRDAGNVDAGDFLRLQLPGDDVCAHVVNARRDMTTLPHGMMRVTQPNMLPADDDSVCAVLLAWPQLAGLWVGLGTIGDALPVLAVLSGRLASLFRRGLRQRRCRSWDVMCARAFSWSGMCCSAC